jgi:predicted nucleic acid-binding protein
LTIIETSVWVDIVRQTQNEQTEWVKQNLGKVRLGLTDLTLCEVLQGMRNDEIHAVVRKELLELEVYATGGVELALAAAENYRSLRKRGITVRTTIDCLIATFCIQGGYELLHRDRDFHPFEEHLGLRVIHPAMQ